MPNDMIPLTPDQVTALVRQAQEADAEPHMDCDPTPIINGLTLRRTLGRQEWGIPEPYGCCGWTINGLAQGTLTRIIVTGDHASGFSDGVQWIHASISHRDTTPDYEDLKLLHRAVFGDRWAYQVFSPAEQHVNIHAHALHLFGRADGERVLPDFGRFGTI